MLLKNNWMVHGFLAFILVIFLLPFSSAGLIEVSVNSSEDLTTAEEEISFQEGTDLNLYIRLKGIYREPGNNNTVEGITIKVKFKNTEDPRDSLTGYPEFQPLCDTCEDPGYDEYLSKFRSSDERFKGYDGLVEFDITFRNSSGDIITGAGEIVEIRLVAQQSSDSSSSGFSFELPAQVEENLVMIIGGFLVIVLLSIGIYTFVLAPEDTTADLYKPVESVDPLKKSLTGVGHKSDLPGESKKLKRLEGNEDDSDEEDEDDYEDEFVDENDDNDFDERKILDELTGTRTIGSQSEDEAGVGEESTAAAVPAKKKAVKKRVARKGVAKRVLKKSPTKIEENEPRIKTPKGMISVECPSCSKVHSVDESTTKFICSCGRRIRV